MPRPTARLVQQIHTQANTQIVEERWTRTPRSTDAQRSSLHFFLVCDYYGCKNPMRCPVAPRWWFLRTGTVQSGPQSCFFFFFFQKTNHCWQLGGERKSDVGEGRGVWTGTSGPRECLSRCGVGAVCLDCCGVS